MDAAKKREAQILKTFETVIPRLSETDKEKLLAFGEGLSFAVRGKPPEMAEKSGVGGIRSA